MDLDRITEMLRTQYTLDLKGNEIAYILMMLAREQHRLNNIARENITDIKATMEAGANEIVGNEFLHAVYDSAGPGLLAFTMSAEEETVERFMNSKDPDEVQAMADKLGVKSPPKKNMH